jgi:hypothetical protein
LVLIRSSIAIKHFYYVQLLTFLLELFSRYLINIFFELFFYRFAYAHDVERSTEMVGSIILAATNCLVSLRPTTFALPTDRPQVFHSDVRH